MIININKYPIINAFYGIKDNKINVLNILLNNLDKKILICNDLFKNDPCYGIVKKLFITLKNNSRYELLENTYVTILTSTQDKSIKKNKDIKQNDNSKNLIQLNNNNNNNILQLNNNNNNNILQLNNNDENNLLKKVDYILSTNVRDENNILEFIIYHILIGFDRIYLIDHLSKLKIQYLVNLLPNEYKNKVQVIRFNDEGAYKLHFLNKMVLPYMKKYCKKYFIHLDGDEYINLNNNYSTIDELLKDYDYPDILNLNWLLFGSNNKKDNDDENNCLIPTYTRCEKNLNNHFKCLINIKIINDNTIYITPHHIYDSNNILEYTNILKYKFNLNNKKKHYDLFVQSHPKISYKDAKAYLNHYTIQSKNDYLRRKVNRNRDDIENTRTLNMQIFSKYNDVVNNNLNKFNNKIKEILKLDDFSFIILRYVINKETNKMWIKCYNSIRKFYNNKIIIIDDNSNKNFITNIKLDNCFIINSDIKKGRGELLPYYYYTKYKFSKRIIVLHDSMKIHNKIDFNNIKYYKNFTRIFSFPNNCYNIDIQYFPEFCKYIKNGNNVLKYHNNNKGKLLGCLEFVILLIMIF